MTDSIITYLRGDATDPQTKQGNRLILHICNDCGGWGRGFVVALSKRWKEPEAAYRKSYPHLGDIQVVQVTFNTYVVNMVAQSGYKSANNPQPLSYDALKECLVKVAARVSLPSTTYHMPRIGCGLAGGTWEEVSVLIEEHLKHPVYVYDLAASFPSG